MRIKILIDVCVRIKASTTYMVVNIPNINLLNSFFFWFSWKSSQCFNCEYFKFGNAHEYQQLEK